MACIGSRPANSACDLKERAKRNGFRRSIFSTHWYPKDKYVGQWRNDEKEGRGMEIYRTGYVYNGEWKEGARHGFGTLSKISSSKCPQSRTVIHMGCWCRGKKHGYGLHWYADSFYKGYFEDGRKKGYGQMWWYSGQYYEGIWENDQFHGKGKIYLTNCNVYEGQFANGKKEGYGIYYHRNTGQIQRGYWTNDMCTEGTMEDAYFRQSSTRPTSYPIPKLTPRPCLPIVAQYNVAESSCCPEFR
ncbi:MORN repeat-containing protein 3-like [Phymastichus coffea]|uniref:MORN repeat-containing protein 3-like n=1 Tax=Phymastichus coffea TaxID=108790 RepID=UPI00273C50F5|nr:MORN repeat-containing protein 3-like [Phymastichus coffea]